MTIYIYIYILIRACIYVCLKLHCDVLRAEWKARVPIFNPAFLLLSQGLCKALYHGFVEAGQGGWLAREGLHTPPQDRWQRVCTAGLKAVEDWPSPFLRSVQFCFACFRISASPIYRQSCCT